MVEITFQVEDVQAAAVTRKQGRKIDIELLKSEVKKIGNALVESAQEIKTKPKKIAFTFGG